MILEDTKIYILIFSFISGIILSLIIIFLIYKRLTRTPAIVECANTGYKVKENKLIILRKYNPGVGDETLTLLNYSFYIILTGYSLVEGSVILDQTNKKGRELNQTDWVDKVWKLNFVHKENKILLELNYMERFLIDNNEFLIEEILCRNSFGHEPQTLVKMVEKNIQTTDPIRTSVSPMEIMFCKYVEYFIYKL